MKKNFYELNDKERKKYKRAFENTQYGDYIFKIYMFAPLCVVVFFTVCEIINIYNNTVLLRDIPLYVCLDGVLLLVGVFAFHENFRKWYEALDVDKEPEKITKKKRFGRKKKTD